MSFFSNKKLFKGNLIGLLLAILPVSFIAGNLAININILIIIISSVIFFKTDILKIKYHLLDKILILLFLFILFTGVYNDLYFILNNLEWKPHFSTIYKSIAFCRFLLLYFILRFLIEKNIINLKLFFISCFIFTVFVCFDIFYQFFNKEDLFGFKIIGRKISGPFGEELIAGGYIQRFSIFSLFLMPLFLLKEKNINFYIAQIILFFIFIIGIILSGNRMPLLIFIFVIFLMLLFQKSLRKFLLPFLTIITVVFVLFYKFNFEIKNNFTSFYKQSSKIFIYTINRDLNNKDAPQYLREFSTFYDTWLMNKYIGGGIKNFRYYCHERPNIDRSLKFVCNMHPHNYYLEILTEIGFIGLLIISTVFIIILYLSLFKKYFYRSGMKNNLIVAPFMFAFFAEIFPIKSTGSFFTTGNATYLFLIMSILVAIIRKENIIEKEI
jgi:O-antigen ligase